MIVNKTIAQGVGASGSFIIRFPLLPDGKVQRLSLSAFASFANKKIKGKIKGKMKEKGRRERERVSSFSLFFFFGILFLTTASTLLGLEF